jgi:hypothetical protein
MEITVTAELSRKLDNIKSALSLRDVIALATPEYNNAISILMQDSLISSNYEAKLLVDRANAITPEAQAEIDAILAVPADILSHGRTYYEGRRDVLSTKITDAKNSITGLRDAIVQDAKYTYSLEEVNEYTKIFNEVNSL